MIHPENPISRQSSQQVGDIFAGNIMNWKDVGEKDTALGVVVVQAEGSAADAVLSADIVVTDILNALDLLRHPLRLTATLRS